MSSLAVVREPTPARTGDVVVIVNGRSSGIDHAERAAMRLMEALAANGRTGEAHVTRNEAELHAALRRARGGRAVLVGGDGSLHAAANAPFDLPELALIPTGRANNVARQLGVARDVDEAARVAVHAPARPLDVLVVTTSDGCHRGVEAVSAGLQADARHGYEAANSGDTFAGLRTLVRSLARYRPWSVELELDGRVAYRGTAGQVFLANLALFGFGFEVNPAANPADGLLEAVVIKAPTRTAAALMLARAYRGRHLDHPAAEYVRARSAALTVPMPLACDGVPIGTTTAHVHVERGLLRVAAPSRP